MKCPFCGCLDTQVKDSRPNEDGSAIKRRRVCPDCGSRFTTLETVFLRELQVIKRDGNKVPFDRTKLSRSIQLAVRRRNIGAERVEKVVNSLVRQFETLGEAEISTDTIGEYVLKSLFVLDKVAYIRYISVYKNFNSLQDFEYLVKELADK